MDQKAKTFQALKELINQIKVSESSIIDFDSIKLVLTSFDLFIKDMKYEPQFYYQVFFTLFVCGVEKDLSIRVFENFIEFLEGEDKILKEGVK